jgi:Glycosyl transferases group 1
MIEALACGTPVIAQPCGSVPEVLRHGVTGLMASGVDDLVQAVHAIPSISWQRCRAEFEARFTANVMAANYERTYCQLIDDPRTRQNGGQPARKIAAGMVECERNPAARSTFGRLGMITNYHFPTIIS